MDERSEDREHDGGTANGAAGSGQVDVAALAERVYRLLREEIRLERARGSKGLVLGSMKRC